MEHLILVSVYMKRGDNSMFESRGFISNPIRIIGVMLFFSTILLLVYAPVLQEAYFHRFDHARIYLPSEAPAKTVLQAKKEGRFTLAFLDYLVVSHVRSSESTRAVRLFAIIGVALFASVIWSILKLSRIRSDHALLISALICILPCSQMYILWLIIIPYIYGAVLSSISALIIFNIAYQENNKGKTYEIIGIISAIILLVIALTIHQSMAMAYWAIGAILALNWDNYDFFRKYRRLLLKYFLVGFVSIGIYYVVFYKILLSVMNILPNRGGFLPIYMFPIKFLTFLQVPFKNALNLWNTYPTYLFASFIIVIIFCGIIFSSLKEIKEKKRFMLINLFQKNFLILCLLMLSYLPNLVILEQAYDYRTLLPLAAVLSVMFCFGLIHIIEFFKFIPTFSPELRNKTITVLLIMLVIVTSLLARYNATHWYGGAQLDVELFRSQKSGYTLTIK